MDGVAGVFHPCRCRCMTRCRSRDGWCRWAAAPTAVATTTTRMPSSVAVTVSCQSTSMCQVRCTHNPCDPVCMCIHSLVWMVVHVLVLNRLPADGRGPPVRHAPAAEEGQGQQGSAPQAAQVSWIWHERTRPGAVATEPGAHWADRKPVAEVQTGGPARSFTSGVWCTYRLKSLTKELVDRTCWSVVALRVGDVFWLRVLL